MSQEANNNEEILEETVETVEETVENMENESADTEKNEECSDEAKESADADSEKKKKGLFSKDKKDKKDEQIAELTDKHQRLMAEFQNFRNRTEKEKAAMFEMGAKSIIEKMLPIVDNFERGLAMMSEEDLESSVGQGMTMIYKQLTTTLEELGVEVIEAQGCEFDPELHNAVTDPRKTFPTPSFEG
ncbi:MAG: nucleotide exchange factor GrpE [Lachnospiraceae bacterium]|nr:nucleotide exchange factor GrpE [Lachnospiraceae bacterium]